MFLKKNIKKSYQEILKIILPESKIKINKFEDWATLLKQYYHVDTILRANNQLWMCNEIKTVDYVEI